MRRALVAVHRIPAAGCTRFAVSRIFDLLFKCDTTFVLRPHEALRSLEDWLWTKWRWMPRRRPVKSRPGRNRVRSSPDHTATHIVGIGASAGGLEALERLFSKMPPDTGMAFVVVQHLSPDFKSLMNELLARWTSMPIHAAEEGMPVAANAIYLMPPKKEMIISDGKLLLTDKGPPDELTLPIDQFFRSLAREAGRRAIAVVLSGTGSDGSRGIRDVHVAGGFVVVQSEETAKFDGMPRSAMETGLADASLAPEEIPAANEEMLASNEELQSTNEELHSVNEELYTVNAEHQRKARRADRIDARHGQPAAQHRRPHHLPRRGHVHPEIHAQNGPGVQPDSGRRRAADRRFRPYHRLRRVAGQTGQRPLARRAF